MSYANSIPDAPPPPPNKQLFGSVRDEWLADDPDGWIEANPLYAGADFPLGCGNWDPYILTTKQTRFVETLLQARGAFELGLRKAGWMDVMDGWKKREGDGRTFKKNNNSQAPTISDNNKTHPNQNPPIGLAVPRDKIFGLGSGPKTDVLARLARLARERAGRDEAAEREAMVSACVRMSVCR